jgi:thiol-disulfide isomerase/thioredoxin
MRYRNRSRPVEALTMVRSTREATRLVAIALAFVAIGGPLAAEPVDKEITLKPVKFSDLEKTVRSYKGKVVLVDFWAEYCVSCKKEFPHLVEMHRKYAHDGLVAVSVALDDPSDLPVRARALAFLKKQRASFLNVLLDETPEFYQTKLKIDGPPCVQIFNRDGRLVISRDGVGPEGHIDYVFFEKRIVELLAEKK